MVLQVIDNRYRTLAQVFFSYRHMVNLEHFEFIQFSHNQLEVILEKNDPFPGLILLFAKQPIGTLFVA